MKDKITFISEISGVEFPVKERVWGESIRMPILNLIKEDYPNFDVSKCIADKELNIYREKYISKFLQSEVGELSDLHKNVIKSLSDDTSFVSKVEDEVDNRTFGQVVADKVADFGGSWTFIISFFIFIMIWIAANVYLLMNKGFDPYPFILLNLILSCLAALQAPVIMMSQNRQEEKDRKRSENDYLINLKSELEIRALNQKIDLLLEEQIKILFDSQAKQLEILKNIEQKMK